jgi:Metal binding domain of Ada
MTLLNLKIHSFENNCSRRFKQNLFNNLMNKLITLAGNKKLKIYGTLQCTSGKRIKKENRVFFKDETEAILLGFRPCGHCLHQKYLCSREDFHSEWINSGHITNTRVPKSSALLITAGLDDLILAIIAPDVLLPSASLFRFLILFF